jgi:hypothetical protein
MEVRLIGGCLLKSKNFGYQGLDTLRKKFLGGGLGLFFLAGAVESVAGDAGADYGLVGLELGADGIEDETGGAEHGVAVKGLDDADGDAVVDAGGVVLDLLDGGEVGEGGEVGFGAEFG